MNLITALPAAIILALWLLFCAVGIYTLIDDVTEYIGRRIRLNSEIKRLQRIYDTAEDDTDRVIALAMLWNCRYERGDKL